jgi:hypothetical protein
MNLDSDSDDNRGVVEDSEDEVADSDVNSSDKEVDESDWEDVEVEDDGENLMEEAQLGFDAL